MSIDPYRAYLADGFTTVEGWVAPAVLPVLEHLSGAASAARAGGGCCEIGVHHGRLFLAMLNIVGGETPSLAIDIFDRQDLNIDQSGKGSLERFRANLAAHSPYADRVETLAADSTALSAADLADIQRRFGTFRLFSVDGGHTADHAINDLIIAQELTANGGVVLLDDFFQPNWPGVTEGLFRFFATSNRRLAPLCLAGSKLFLTTLSYHRRYLTGLTSHLARTHPAARIKPVALCGWDAASFMLG